MHIWCSWNSNKLEVLHEAKVLRWTFVGRKQTPKNWSFLLSQTNTIVGIKVTDEEDKDLERKSTLFFLSNRRVNAHVDAIRIFTRYTIILANNKCHKVSWHKWTASEFHHFPGRIFLQVTFINARLKEKCRYYKYEALSLHSKINNF